MTKLTKRIRRETFAVDPIKGERICIILESDGVTMTLRQKRKRLALTVTYPEIYRLAYQKAAHAARAERQRAKKAKKEARK
jgi:hypothetical protein